MKKQNLFRNLMMVALLVGGIFAAGAGDNAFGQDRSGFMTSGGRSERTDGTGGLGSGCCASTASNSDATDTSGIGMFGGGTMGTGTSSTGSGTSTGGGGSKGGTANEESESLLNLILGYFF